MTLPDWPAIAADYRRGHLSLRAMAAKHRCSHSAIANRARRERWVREGRDRAVTGAASGLQDGAAPIRPRAACPGGPAGEAPPKHAAQDTARPRHGFAWPHWAVAVSEDEGPRIS